jgi:hypothetical protein
VDAGCGIVAPLGCLDNIRQMPLFTCSRAHFQMVVARRFIRFGRNSGLYAATVYQQIIMAVLSYIDVYWEARLVQMSESPDVERSRSNELESVRLTLGPKPSL